MLNKKVIKDYPLEFQAWIDDKTIHAKRGTSIWFQVTNTTNIWEDATITDLVLNDKYVEIRKALIEGKSVKKKLIVGKEEVWKDLLANELFMSPLDFYKIVENNFKSGDWIVCKNTIYTFRGVIDDKRLAVKGYGTNWVNTKDNPELWEPKLNEWVVFWDDENDRLVRKFDKKKENYYLDSYGCRWHKVAPLELIDKLKGER